MSWRHELEDSMREPEGDLDLLWQHRDRDDEHAPIESIVGTPQELLACVARLKREVEQLTESNEVLRSWIGSMWAENGPPF